jgi:hypothetical protein
MIDLKRELKEMKANLSQVETRLEASSKLNPTNPNKMLLAELATLLWHFHGPILHCTGLVSL